MARLGRSVVWSLLRRPTVVGAATTFSGPKVSTFVAARAPAYLILQRKPHSRLQPPTIITPAAALTPGPVRVALARTARPPYATHAELGKPTIVAPAVTFAAVETKLVRPPRASQHTISELRAPIFIGPATVFAAVKATLARQPRQFQKAVSRLQRPVVVAPGVIFAAVKTRLAPSAKQARQAHSRLQAPQAVAPAVVFAPIKVKLAAKPRPPRVKPQGLFKIPAPPVVLTLDQQTLTAKFAPRYPQPVTHSFLRKPTVVLHPVTRDQQQLQVWLVQHPKQGRDTTWLLRLPGSTVAAGQPVVTWRTFAVGPSGETLDNPASGATSDRPGASWTDAPGPDGKTDATGPTGVTLARR